MDQKRLIFGGLPVARGALRRGRSSSERCSERRARHRAAADRVDRREPTCGAGSSRRAPRAQRPPTAADPSAPPRESIEASAEQRVEVDTGPGHAVFTNRGAQLLSYRVKDVIGKDGQPLEMVRARAEGPYPFALTDPTGAPLAVNDALFAVEGPERGESGTSQVVRFRYSGAAGAATKEFRFLEQWAARGGDPPRRHAIPGVS